MAVSKPLPGVPIDPASPWARGLVNAVVGGQSGQRVINYAPNFNGVDGAGTALRFAGSPSGGAIKTNGSTAYVNFGNQPRMRGTGAFTVAMRFKLNSLTAANIPVVYSTGFDGVDLNLYAGFAVGPPTPGSDTKLWLVCGGSSSSATYRGGSTNTSFSSLVGQYVDVLLEYTGSAYGIDVNGVRDFTQVSGSARVSNGSKITVGAFDLNGTIARFSDLDLEYLYHWEGRTFTAAEKAALRANPYQLWPDDQIVFAPASGINITPDPATLTLTGYAPTVTAPAAVTPTPASLTLTGYAPTVAAPASITPTPATLTLTGYPPTVTTSAATNDSEWIITARRRGRR